MFLENLFYYVGLWSVISYFYINFKSPISILISVLLEYLQIKRKINFDEEYGNWAVITGSTDGIGKEYAKEFAKRGINIVLVSRSQEKLIRVATEIEEHFDVKTKYIVADFTKGREIYNHIKAELKGIPVGILVNNVGLAPAGAESFIDNSEEFLWNIIQVNMTAITMMTNIVLQDMKTREKGLIINISSISQNDPMPYLTAYAATKAYVHSLNDALRYELELFENIKVQLVTPSFVSTNMTEAIRNTDLDNKYLIEELDTFIAQAFQTLGRTSETTGCWKHGLFAFVLSLIPVKIRIYLWNLKGYNMKVQYDRKMELKKNVS